MKANARIVLVGDPDQLPSVGAGNVFREIIETQIVPVTVLDQIFRQSKDSLIAYNAKFINEGNTKLFYGPDFVFVSGDSQEDTAEKITERYCLEIQESGIENVQILSPFRSEGAASSEQLNIPVAGFLVTLLLLSKMPAIGNSIISSVESSPILPVLIVVFSIVAMYAVSIILSIRIMKKKEM